MVPPAGRPGRPEGRPHPSAEGLAGAAERASPEGSASAVVEEEAEGIIHVEQSADCRSRLWFGRFPHHHLPNPVASASPVAIPAARRDPPDRYQRVQPLRYRVPNGMAFPAHAGGSRCCLTVVHGAEHGRRRYRGPLLAAGVGGGATTRRPDRRAQYRLRPRQVQ